MNTIILIILAFMLLTLIGAKPVQKPPRPPLPSNICPKCKKNRIHHQDARLGRRRVALPGMLP